MVPYWTLEETVETKDIIMVTRKLDLKIEKLIEKHTKKAYNWKASNIFGLAVCLTITIAAIKDILSEWEDIQKLIYTHYPKSTEVDWIKDLYNDTLVHYFR